MKKQDIFDTSLALIVNQGLHATPMSQIANEANVAAGTIYHYFKSKEEMIHELYHNIRGELETVLMADEIDTANYQMEFTSMCLSMFKFFMQQPLKFSFLQQYEHSPLGIQSAELDTIIEYPVPVDFLSLGVDLNFLKAVPLSFHSNLIYANIIALARLQLTEKVSLNKEMIQSVIDGIWNMIKK